MSIIEAERVELVHLWDPLTTNAVFYALFVDGQYRRDVLLTVGKEKRYKVYRGKARTAFLRSKGLVLDPATRGLRSPKRNPVRAEDERHYSCRNCGRLVVAMKGLKEVLCERCARLEHLGVIPPLSRNPGKDYHLDKAREATDKSERYNKDEVLRNAYHFVRKSQLESAADSGASPYEIERAGAYPALQQWYRMHPGRNPGNEFQEGEIVEYKDEKVRVLPLAQVGDRVNIWIPSRQESVWVKPDRLARISVTGDKSELSQWEKEIYESHHVIRTWPKSQWPSAARHFGWLPLPPVGKTQRFSR